VIAIAAIAAFCALAQDGAAKSPASQVSVGLAIQSGVRWLLDNQNDDGSWGSHHSARPEEVLASIPHSQEAFRVATTALCVMALSDANIATAESAKSADRALDFLLEHYDVKRQSPLEHYNVWAFGFGLQCFGERLAKNPEDPRAAKFRDASKKLVERLGQMQTLDGGWGYLSMNDVPTAQPSDTSMAFTTATCLVGLDRAKKIGIEMPDAMKTRAIDEIERSRLSDGAFVYGDYLQYRPRLLVNRVKGSACRAPACLYALDLFRRELKRGSVDPKDLSNALEDLLVRHAAFQKQGVRRPIPHESDYQISGYFYLYGHAYAAYVLERLPAADQARLWPLVADAVLYCREPDGSFWDYPLYSYHKPYGTAFALLALARVPRAPAK
jgi:hypothetical protein